MKTELKLRIEKAIDDAIQNSAEEDLWDGFIHEKLSQQMANAAEQVFDAAMEAQEYLKAQADV